jgi:hypothetical protein
MTEPTPEVEPAAEEPTSELIDHGQETEPEADDDTPMTLSEARKLRRESAGLRRRVRELEAEHVDYEGAAARLSALEHAEVERIAAEQLIDGSDVWRVQPDLTAYYDEEFKQVILDKVRDAVQALIESKPHLARPVRPPTNQPIEGLRGGASPELKKTEVTWASALRRSI